MDFTVVRATVWAIATEFGLKILGAIVLWFVGRWLIQLLIRLFSAGMNRRHFDPTIVSYLKTSLSVLLTIILVIAILGVFGIQTTSFAALLAAGGVAIGLAWSGLLANFAAGVFLVILRPFRVGDFVTAGGVTGTAYGILHDNIQHALAVGHAPAPARRRDRSYRARCRLWHRSPLRPSLGD